MTKKHRLIIPIVLLLGLIATGVIAYTRDQDNVAPAAPIFSYDETQTEGWWSAGNRNAQSSVDEANYDEVASGPISELPVADISIHHGKPGGEEHNDRCFVSLSYYNYPLGNVAAAYQEYERDIDEFGSFERLKNLEQTIRTHEGSKSYELRHYRTEADSGEEFLSGTQIGFVALRDGYIRIQGVCQTPEDLALTVPVISSAYLQ